MASVYLMDTQSPAAVGNIYRINDTAGRFVVVAVDDRYASVTNLNGKHPRCILVRNLRTSKAQHGYTLIEEGRA